MGELDSGGEGPESQEATEAGETVSDTEFLVDCEIALAQATAEKMQAEAELTMWTAKITEIEYEQARINHNHQLNGVYTFHRGVSRKSMDKLFEAMHMWHSLDSTAPWTIYLNSGGGDVISGNGIIDEIAAHSIQGGGSHHVTIKVRGQASSMAGMILQAADHRVMGPHSLLMIHKGTCGFEGTVEAFEDEVAWLRTSTEWMSRLFLSRTDKITEAEFMDKIDRRDWWLTSDQAIKIGFADAIG